jgi:hypothetical protein
MLFNLTSASKIMPKAEKVHKRQGMESERFDPSEVENPVDFVSERVPRHNELQYVTPSRKMDAFDFDPMIKTKPATKATDKSDNIDIDSRYQNTILDYYNF